MYVIQSIEDTKSIPRNNSSLRTVTSLTEQLIEAYTYPGHTYSPDDDGYMALVEASDTSRILHELKIPYRLIDIPWEGVSMIDNHFYALYMANNQFGIGFVIPNEDWLPDDLRSVLEDNLDPEF